MVDNKIVLCMIVKNEAHVIERCLASCLPITDTWCIVDTGSTDGTQQKIKDFFSALGIEGKLIEEPWQNFAANRSSALAHARPMGTYTWMIDADEILEFENSFDLAQFKKNLTHDICNIFAHYGGIKYHRPQLTSNKKEFYYKGILHEYVACKDKIESQTFAPGVLNRPIQDGARSKNPEKYKHDAELLRNAIDSKTVDADDINRYHFYLAQSYRDAGMHKEALEWYLKRAELGGWPEEVFYSLFQAGILKERLGESVDSIVKTHFMAYQVAPWRAESLWAAARVCKEYMRTDQGYHFAKQALKIPKPIGALFVSEFVYDWAILYEFSTLAYWSGKYKECKQAIEHLLKENRFPPDEKPRLEANLKFAIDGLLQE